MDGTRTSRQAVSAQLRVGDNYLASWRAEDIIAKIDAAADLAGVERLLFQPTRDQRINARIIEHAKKRGLELFLWYLVLADNDCIPQENELLVDAFGKSRAGETQHWQELRHSEDAFLAACPTTEPYNRVILERARRLVADYDGIFLDTIGYPLPSIGFEGMFTCFCPHCLAREPRLAAWRTRVRDLKERVNAATDADLARWGTFSGMFGDAGLDGFVDYRNGLIADIVEKYAVMARELGKGIGTDILTPALASLAGHDLRALGALVDWVKPRIYCCALYPSSLPLEFYCAAMGIKTWGKRLSMGEIVAFVGRSFGTGAPPRLEKPWMSEKLLRDEIRRTIDVSAAPVYPSLECSLDPEFGSKLNGKIFRSRVDVMREAAGFVLAWNILYTPDEFFTLVGKR